MSSVGTICKDDNRAQGFLFRRHTPFMFNWEIGEEDFSQQNDVLVIDSFHL